MASRDTSVFDASNFFAATKPSESRYMEEGSFTGPLDKLLASG